MQKIGVFVCWCGSNIAATVDVEKVSQTLAHEPGVLSALLATISAAGGSVLTITQSLPIHDRASVTISLDVSSISCELGNLLELIEGTPGVDHARLLAIE